ncbi:hypothetical protein E2P81_ATG08764 [Venturia nashicola]|nr:hypothetical protein E2P81_ATG08764 [Venturia nashicola]
MKTLIVLFLAVAAFAAPQVSTNPPANPLSAAGGATASPAAMECLSQCATTAFGVDAMSLTPDTIPCAKEYSGSFSLFWNASLV